MVEQNAPSIATLAARFSEWLNGTYPPELDTEALHWRRISKVCEEAGEVREALGAWFHENPRKPQGSVDDVVAELADCVGAALGAIEHLTGHGGRSLEIATARVKFVCERVGVSTASSPECDRHRAWQDDTTGEFFCIDCGKTAAGEESA
jgi:hypothetical protein